MYEPYPTARKQEVAAQVRRYVDGSIDELNVRALLQSKNFLTYSSLTAVQVESLRHVLETYAVFREMVRDAESRATNLQTLVRTLQPPKKTEAEVRQSKMNNFFIIKNIFCAFKLTGAFRSSNNRPGCRKSSQKIPASS